MGRRRATPNPAPAGAETYEHPTATTPLRPDVGMQAQFKKTKPAQKYRYDSSLSPALDFDGQNPAREQAEALIRAVLDAKTLDEAKAAAAKLKAMGQPFLNWAGKAEHLSFEVPTLPLFIHERLSTRAIIESLKGHKRQMSLLDLFSDPEHSIADQLLKSYEHSDKWTNRMILGDSLAVMNSLLHFEQLGGQVQMIYMDPPYGVKYGSNFQPFVRNRDVTHNDDEDFTREPEMVQAYRDTWEIGLHSYLTYMRDRLLLSRDMLHPSGSIFVQISDENLHHVRELLDEVFGSENYLSVIQFRKTGGLGTKGIKVVCDYLLWYAKDIERLKYHPIYSDKDDTEASNAFKPIEALRQLVKDKKVKHVKIPSNATEYMTVSLTSSGTTQTCIYGFEFEGKTYWPVSGYSWKPNQASMEKLAEEGRLIATGSTLRWIYYKEDFPISEITNTWNDTGGASDKLYVVQTSSKVVERCLLMTTDPGDMILDPTCGSGTTAYVAEQWGRRWITTDVSRVPLALARQRLLTATFPWYDLKDPDRGPASGFVYKRKQNRKGEEVGGIVPHVTLRSIANNEPPKEEVLVDRPESKPNITRVSGPFTVEATIPTAMEMEGTGSPPADAAGAAAVEATGGQDRLLEVLRKSPVLRQDKNRTITFKNIRPPAKSLSLSAEGIQLNGDEKAVAFVFGPENGPVSEKRVFAAMQEASMRGLAHLYVIGFAIEAKARQLIEASAAMGNIPATYVAATPDLLMGDLLKNMRSSQIFSVCGLPEVTVEKVKGKAKGEAQKYQVTLLGLDVFNPTTMETESRNGDDVPAWLLDTDYNGRVFHVAQAFFPRTSAWNNLKKELKADYNAELWDHLAGTTSAPFEAGDHKEIAVKVIDDRGNELLVVKSL
jgi:adenine-specific DNA-methyltransferase